MMGNGLDCHEDLTELGEIAVCVYIYIKYDMKKAMQYMLWKGFRNDLLIEYDEMLLFYQDEKFMPNKLIDGEFYKILDSGDIWENCPYTPNYKYRSLSEGVICISYVPDI